MRGRDESLLPLAPLALPSLDAPQSGAASSARPAMSAGHNRMRGESVMTFRREPLGCTFFLVFFLGVTILVMGLGLIWLTIMELLK